MHLRSHFIYFMLTILASCSSAPKKDEEQKQPQVQQSTKEQLLKGINTEDTIILDSLGRIVYPKDLSKFDWAKEDYRYWVALLGFMFIRTESGKEYTAKAIVVRPINTNDAIDPSKLQSLQNKNEAEEKKIPQANKFDS